jgi:hypothetical protein
MLRNRAGRFRTASPTFHVRHLFISLFSFLFNHYPHILFVAPVHGSYMSVPLSPPHLYALGFCNQFSLMH